MKPSEAVGLIRYNRHFGRSKVIEYLGGKLFRCESLDKHPGVTYTTGWVGLKRS